MKIEYGTRDIIYTDDGDFLIDDNTGDFLIKSDANGDITSQTIAKRVFSNPGDWKMMQDYGSGIMNLVGNEATSDIITVIKSSIFDVLTREFTLDSREFETKVIPLSPREFSVIILVKKRYMNQPVVVSGSISSNFFTNKTGKINSIGLGR